MKTTGLLTAVALCFLAFLALCTVFFGYLTVKVFTDIKSFTDSDRPYSPEEIVVVTGRIDRVEGGPMWQLWIEGQDLPFRGLLSREVFNELQAHEGESVKIGVLRTEQESPPRDYRHGQDFLRVYSLEINGRTALSLDDYNRRSATNAIGLKLVIPLFFLSSVGVWVWMFRHRHTPVAKLLEPRPRRFRDFVPVGIILGFFVAALVGGRGWSGEGWAGEWAGPGPGGLFLGIAGGFAIGMCLAAVLGAVVAASRRIDRWVDKSKRRSTALSIATLIAVGVILIIAWKVYLRFFVFGLIVWAIVTVLRRAAIVEQVTPSSERGEIAANESGSRPQ